LNEAVAARRVASVAASVGGFFFGSRVAVASWSNAVKAVAEEDAVTGEDECKALRRIRFALCVDHGDPKVEVGWMTDALVVFEWLENVGGEKPILLGGVGVEAVEVDGDTDF